MPDSFSAGHNETAVRLAALAGDAQIALDRVAKGEADALAGWLAYGAALNEGRALFPGDREFGEWLRSSNLEDGVHPAEQSAAMWAAANAEQFEEAKAAGNARTVRGIHAKWKEIEAERERAAREAEEKAEREARALTQQANPAPREQTLSKVAGVQDGGDLEGLAAPRSDALAAGGASLTPPAEPILSQGHNDDKATAKLRREFRAMTPEAQEDDWIALRQEIADLRKRVMRQRDELADKNATIKSLSEGSDMGAKLSAKIREVGALKLSRDEALRAAKSMEFRLKKAEARVKELESEAVEI